MDLRELIPKHKFDDSNIEVLKSLSFQEIKPIVPDLLEWLQDLHWPIARSVAELLAPFVGLIVPELIRILKTNDAWWEFGIMVCFCRTTSDTLLLQEIKRIALSPTKHEGEEGIHIEAQAILNGDYK